ncbi:hypothetical protein GCM10009411_18520 [Shewanella litoralis]|uniref:Uncharacterized protein n=1 Tax=Shewanella litoralis TaxID=2282700 RepID=A0ABQ2RBP1_9GAMM|nr:hypothetical protein GCM10009411_18520 [Shewanella litoralis]
MGLVFSPFNGFDEISTIDCALCINRLLFTRTKTPREHKNNNALYHNKITVFYVGEVDINELILNT